MFTNKKKYKCCFSFANKTKKILRKKYDLKLLKLFSAVFSLFMEKYKHHMKRLQ